MPPVPGVDGLPMSGLGCCTAQLPPQLQTSATVGEEALMPTQAVGVGSLEWMGGWKDRKKAGRRRQQCWEQMAWRPGSSRTNHTCKRSWETSVADKVLDGPSTNISAPLRDAVGWQWTDFSQCTYCLKSGQLLNKQRSPSELPLGCSLVLA